MHVRSEFCNFYGPKYKPIPTSPDIHLHINFFLLVVDFHRDEINFKKFLSGHPNE